MKDDPEANKIPSADGDTVAAAMARGDNPIIVRVPTDLFAPHEHKYECARGDSAPAVTWPVIEKALKSIGYCDAIVDVSRRVRERSSRLTFAGIDNSVKLAELDAVHAILAELIDARSRR